MNIRKTLGIAALTLVIAASANACSSRDGNAEAPRDDEAPIAVCYMAGDPALTSGAMPSAAMCECQAAATEDEDDADNTAPVLEPAEEVAAAPERVTDSASDGTRSSLRPLDEPTGKECGTGFCKTDWAKKKLREIAACVGIGAACLGGNAEISKVVIKLAQTVCCATDKKAQDAVVKDLQGKLKTACAGADAGLEAGKK